MASDSFKLCSNLRVASDFLKLGVGQLTTTTELALSKHMVYYDFIN